jgi:lipid II isoglutaminyl synthase (glutamine-hydrolysing)
MKTVKIVHLYAQEMNIYGDTGNVIILKKRLEWRGIKTNVTRIGVSDKIPKDTNIIIGGGGQDSGQSKITYDLATKRDELMAMKKDGVVMLMICGMYQLFGHYFKTQSGETIKGLGILDLYTEAAKGRLIGNISTKTEWGDLIGYENHSGKTYLGSVSTLGTAKKGQGNNGADRTEGAYEASVFGTYLHGPVLAKSPIFSDMLLEKALLNAGIDTKLSSLNDTIAQKAATIANNRPR